MKQMMRWTGLLAALAVAGSVVGQAPPPTGEVRRDISQGASVAKILDSMGIDQNLGESVPKDVRFKDETGKEILFGSLLGKRPIVIMPMFFTCASACGRQVESLMRGVIKLKDRTVGKDFDVVFLSINPKETPELAFGKKQTAMKDYDRPGSEVGWHFLTGELDQIKRLTDALGFRWVYRETTDQIYHPSGLMILTPQGKISEYVYGVEYPSLVLSQGVDRAGKEQIGRPAEVILFGCLAIDPETGRRTLVIENVLKISAILTALGLFGWIGYMSVRYRRSPLEDEALGDGDSQEPGAKTQS